MKPQSKFYSSLITSWIPKILSFVLAVLIVLAVRFMNVNDRVVTVPLTVILPSSSEITPISLVPETVDIVITGSDSVIYLVDPSTIRASVDFSDETKDGISRRPVRLEYNSSVFTEAGLSLDSKPSTIRILFSEGSGE